MSDMPMEIEEAAMIDGCNRAQAFVKVELPMLVPSIIACGVYIFMNAWNEYTFAVMFTNENNRTISVALKNLVGQLGVEWDLMTAGGLIAVLPICIMFFFAQKRLVAGLTAGAVKDKSNKRKEKINEKTVACPVSHATDIHVCWMHTAICRTA